MFFLNRKIFSFEDNFFGLDLSDLSVKLFQLEKKGDLDKIRSHSAVDIPSEYVEDGKIINKVKVAEAIKYAIRIAGPKKISTRKVICSLPESKAFLRIISIPKVSEAEAREAIKWEIEASIPLSVDEVYFDWQFLDEFEGKQNVLTVAISKEVVDTFTEVLGYCGLEPYVFEIESIASARSLIPQNSPKEKVSLIIDLGAQKTSFIITEGSMPYFTSSIPFSSEGMTDVIAKSLGVGREEAERIKLTQGVEYSYENNTGSIFNSVKSLLENLSSEIEKTMDFYRSLSKSSNDIEKIILCGGGSNLRGLVPYLTTRLCKDVSVGDPWINLNLGNNLPIINKENSIRYSTAVGLAMRTKIYGD